MIDAVSGDGRIGRLGLFSLLNDLIKETLSFGFAPALVIWAKARKGEGELGDRDRLMVAEAFVDHGGAQ
jgi:hypothetical protein